MQLTRCLSAVAELLVNISTIISTVLCMYITAPPVNYSILCLSSTVHIVAFVNFLLKKMVVVVVVVVMPLQRGAEPPADNFRATGLRKGKCDKRVRLEPRR